MKKMRKLCILALSLIALFFGFRPVNAEGKDYIIDRDGLFNEQERSELNTLADKLYGETGLETYIVFDSSYEDVDQLVSESADMYLFTENSILYGIGATEINAWANSQELFGMFENSGQFAKIMSDCFEVDTWYECATTLLQMTADTYKEAKAVANPAPSYATDLPLLVDDANLLTDTQRTELTKKLQQVSERHSMDICVATVETMNGVDVETYTDDFYDHAGYKEDGVMLLLAMDTRDAHILTTGYGIIALTDYGQDQIWDEILPYLSSGDYNDGFTKFAEMCDDYITKAEAGTPVDITAPEPQKHNPLPFALPSSLLLGGLVGALKTKGEKAKLKSIHKQRSAVSYLQDNATRMYGSYDRFMYSRTSRTKIERDNSRSSGGGGGSTTHITSSGHTHGGSSRKF